MLAVSQPLKDIVLLPASWYTAAPLLIFPFTLALLMLFNPVYFTAYKNLYILTKIISTAGIVRYVFSAIMVMRQNATLATNYARKLLAILLIFFVFDVILVIYEFYKKGGNAECK
jgi:hypothetical protein